MASPTSQKADARPIAFAIHDTTNGSVPAILQMVIRPEDLSRSETSRMTVHQTLGGAWADAFGPGVPTVNISGHTGWGAGGRPDGFEEFVKLHTAVFSEWHSLREKAVNAGNDPDGVKLIFDDGLDEFTWCVAPMAFVLRRNKARPLLSQYQISMTKLGDEVLELPKKTPMANAIGGAGLSSLSGAIGTITSFAANLKGLVATALGPLTKGIAGLVSLTASALQQVQAIAKAGIDGLRSVVGPILDIAHGLAQAAMNVMNIVATIKSIPLAVKAIFMGVKSAFQNAFCLLRNVFKVSGFLPQYGDLYGASNCSSTSGGSPMSPYIGTNVMPSLFPAAKPAVTVTAAGQAALGSLVNLDPLKPIATAQLSGALDAVKGGVTIAPDVVSNAIANMGGTGVSI